MLGKYMTTQSGAGVLELLRLFKQNPAAADQYAAACLEKARAAEPVLKAFEYLPQDVARRPGPLSGGDQGHHRHRRHADHQRLADLQG
jgi:hypothetical protein